ncbi:hypothetical protein LTR50_004412 [Elasticomyces elasticus]|nr:hypothetical protein LTR50_004412 [Elasticomyces elasticus]
MNLSLHFLSILAAINTTFASGSDAHGQSIVLDVPDSGVDAEAYDDGTYGPYPVREYESTNFTSPYFNVLQQSPACHDDSLFTFFTPRGYATGSYGSYGPMIVDADGELVWSFTGFEQQAYDLKVQEYEGENVLTFWVGDDRVRGHGAGNYHILNSSYDFMRSVSAANNRSGDLHDFILSPAGTALMTIYEVIPWDLSPFRDFEAGEQDPNYIWDCLFQEVDLKTGEAKFEWRASDHYAIDDTFHGIGPGGNLADPYDWFHINSVQKDELGNYLISARYTHSITYINGTTGNIIWILGGKRNMFKDLSGGEATNFAFQHDARMHPLNTFPQLMSSTIKQNKDGGATRRLITLFDNSAEDQHYEYGPPMSRGLLLEIAYPDPSMPSTNYSPLHTTAPPKRKPSKPPNPPHTVRLIQSYINPSHIISSSQGSLQLLPAPAPGKDPVVLVAYGYNPAFTAFASDGAVLCDTHFGPAAAFESGDVQSYRVLRFPWVGRPRDAPSVVLGVEDGGAAVAWVSWLGATEVKGWVLQSAKARGAGEGQWVDYVTVAKERFETAIEYEEDGVGRYMRVVALDKDGDEIGRSAVVEAEYTLTLATLSLHIHLPSSTIVPLKTVTLLACNASIILLLYQCHRRFLGWRRSRLWRRRGFGVLGHA